LLVAIALGTLTEKKKIKLLDDVFSCSKKTFVCEQSRHIRMMHIQTFACDMSFHHSDGNECEQSFDAYLLMEYP